MKAAAVLRRAEFRVEICAVVSFQGLTRVSTRATVPGRTTRVTSARASHTGCMAGPRTLAEPGMAISNSPSRSAPRAAGHGEQDRNAEKDRSGQTPRMEERRPGASTCKPAWHRLRCSSPACIRRSFCVASRCGRFHGPRRTASACGRRALPNFPGAPSRDRRRKENNPR